MIRQRPAVEAPQLSKADSDKEVLWIDEHSRAMDLRGEKKSLGPRLYVHVEFATPKQISGDSITLWDTLHYALSARIEMMAHRIPFASSTDAFRPSSIDSTMKVDLQEEKSKTFNSEITELRLFFSKLEGDVVEPLDKIS
jgi:hypothetical protein